MTSSTSEWVMGWLVVAHTPPPSSTCTLGVGLLHLPLPPVSRVRIQIDDIEPDLGVLPVDGLGLGEHAGPAPLHLLHHHDRVEGHQGGLNLG